MTKAISDSDTIPAWVYALAKAGHSAPSADNSQPWLFIWDERNLSVTFDTHRGEGGLSRNHPAVQLAFGAVIENMIQAGTAIGMDVTGWDLSYLTSGEGPFLVVPAPVSDLTFPQLPEWITARHTNRGKYFRTPLTNEVADKLAQLKEGNAAIAVYNDPKTIHELSKILRRASETRFQTEEIHRWLVESLRFTPDEANKGDGLDIETLDLPPGGKQFLKFISAWNRMKALNRLRIYKLLSYFEAVQFEQCGSILAIVGKHDNNPGSWITAGRLMERLWLELSKKGLSVHPYFVVPDLLYRLKAGQVPSSLKGKAGGIASSAREFLGLQDSALYMLLRVGKEKSSPKRSKRLPLNAVLQHKKSD